MTEAQAVTKAVANGKYSDGNSEAVVKQTRSRKARPKPKAYAESQLRKPSFQPPRVAEEGRSFESVDVNYSFALTPDGNEMYFKKDKNTGVRLSDRTLWNCQGLTVYEFVW